MALGSRGQSAVLLPVSTGTIDRRRLNCFNLAILLVNMTLDRLIAAH